MSFIRSAISSAINLAGATALRISGVAPLSVFFDGAGITASDTSLPLHEHEYWWDFGDGSGTLSGATTWAFGSRPGVSSRNTGYGPMAHHVFERVGTFTVTLRDALGTTSKTFTITVDDPDVVFASTTAVLSTNTDFTGAPSGTQYSNVTDLATTVATAISAGSKRILLHKGQTFSTANPVGIATTGAGILGAFGSGAIPKIQATSGYPADTACIVVGDLGSPTLGDWRFVDLYVDGSLIPFAANSFYGIYWNGTFDQSLILRCTFDGCRVSIFADEDILDGHTPASHIWRQFAVQDSTVKNGAKGTPVAGPTATYGLYVSMAYGAFQGNSFDINAATGDPMTHVVRIPYTYKAVISNNDLKHAGDTRHALKIHAPTWGSGVLASAADLGAGYTQYVLVSDNYVDSPASDWQFAIGPQNNTSDERVKDVITERNYHVPGPSVQVCQILMADNATVRNNVMNMSGGPDCQAINFGQRGIEPVHAGGFAYNNTAYTPDATGNYVCVTVGTTTGVIARNNLGEARSATGPAMVSGSATSSNNTLNAGGASPFVGPLTSMAGFKIGLANAAGTHTAPIFFDAFGKVRATGTAVDVGAHQFA